MGSCWLVVQGNNCHSGAVKAVGALVTLYPQLVTLYPQTGSQQGILVLSQLPLFYEALDLSVGNGAAL